MTKHDLGMTKISQYWKRGYRTGYGYAAVTTKHALSSKSFWFRELLRILIRGGGFLMLMLIGFSGSVWNIFFITLFIPASILILYPRIFRVNYFMHEKHLPVTQARQYALHCAFVVIPEFFGVLRFFITVLTGKPLRNRTRQLKTRISTVKAGA